MKKVVIILLVILPFLLIYFISVTGRILEKYSHIFRDDYSIYMRTDNQGLYIYSLMSFSEGGYVLSDITFDLHSTGEDLITTEYEDKFSSKGMPIYAVVATKKCVKK
mgnify:CR=1 FL=1